MTRRRTITAALERRIIMAQLAEGLAGYDAVMWRRHAQDRQRVCGLLLCAWCKEPLLADTPVIHEHMTPLCMGGADDETNIRLVHKQCADKKTNGTKATTAGSDIHANAKCKRLRGETGQRKWKREWPSRKLQSRAWERRK